MPQASKDVWAQVDYSYTHTSGNNTTGASGYDERAGTLSLGHDVALNPQWRVGVGLVGNDDTLSFDDRDASGHINGGQILLYGAYTPTNVPLFVKAGVSAGWWNNTIKRTVSVGDLSGSTRGSFDTTAQSLYSEVGTTLHLNQHAYLQPYLTGNLVFGQQQGYDERTSSGSDAFALDYDNQSSTSVTSTLGMRLGQQNLLVAGHVLNWQVDAGWQHRYGSRTTTSQTAFDNAPDNAFQVTGTRLDADTAVLSAGMGWSIGARAQVYAKLATALSASVHAYDSMGGVMWRW